MAAFEEAGQSPSLTGVPALWAQIQRNLGRAYLQRIRGDRAENLERAIAACEATLSVRTRESMPIDWANTQHNLAIAYGRRIYGDRANNLERAIAACEAALSVRTREALPADWAVTQQNSAIAYQELSTARKRITSSGRSPSTKRR